jgi:Flp pilus assembly protein TadD
MATVIPPPGSDSDPEDASTGIRPEGRLARIGRGFRRIAAFSPRAQWWRLLDLLEERPQLVRRVILAVSALAVVAIAGGFAYVRWHRMNSIRVARQWLAADRMDRAPAAVQRALNEQPLRPEPWELASALAWRRGQKLAALGYAEHAALASHDAFPYVLEWAESAVLAEKPEEAARALARMDPAALSQSSRALRVAGEIERQQGRYLAARDRFAAALKVDSAGPVSASDNRLAVDEVPLGLVQLRTGDPADHRRAIEVLSRWAADPRWGADAMRDLLADAMNRQDRPAMIRWAEALRAHPRLTVGDLPICLAALSAADPARYRAALTTLEGEFGQDPNRIAVLLGWLTQIGRSEDGLIWSRTLPAALTQQPPATIAIAEALRKGAHWTELAAWVGRGPWGSETEFLRSCYRLQAAAALGDKRESALAWSTLQTQVHNQGAFAMFAGANLYTWGLRDQAIALLWIAADHPNVAVEALGTIIRHYQLQHDAAGEYQAFRRLHSLRPNDPGIAHNFAFFAVLTGQYDFAEVERIARENFQRDPANPLYRSNYAFLLDSTGRTPQALALLAPKADLWHTVQGFAFVYGLALAHNGQKAEARPVLEHVEQLTLSQAERDRIQAALQPAS